MAAIVKKKQKKPYFNKNMFGEKCFSWEQLQGWWVQHGRLVGGLKFHPPHAAAWVAGGAPRLASGERSASD